MAGMDHGDMKMQGGSAPADARDPNAYSDGYTLDTGKYALPGPERLRLADEHSFGAVLFDRLERVYGNDGNGTSYDAQAWFGRNYNRLVVKAEGEYANSKLEDARTEVLWGHAIASYWDTQLGVRFDSGEGPNRTWAAFGVQGLAPYWFELDATAYVGNEGRTALRLSAEYELLLTQRLVLQPRIEDQCCTARMMSPVASAVVSPTPWPACACVMRFPASLHPMSASNGPANTAEPLTWPRTRAHEPAIPCGLPACASGFDKDAGARD
jgi:copper resistance protein B